MFERREAGGVEVVEEEKDLSLEREADGEKEPSARADRTRFRPPRAHLLAAAFPVREKLGSANALTGLEM